MRRPKKIFVCGTTDGLDEVFAKFRGSTPLANDTETTGLDWTEDRVGSINLASGKYAGFFWGDALGPAAKFMGEQVKQKRELVFHNAKFDMHFQRETFGLHIPYPVHDTFLESFLIDNRGVRSHRGHRNEKRPHSLKPLASVFVDPEATEPEKEMLAAIKGAGGKHKGDWLVLMGTDKEHLVTEYGALDPWYTLQLHQLFLERIDNWPQPSDEDCPSLRSLYETERWVILAMRDMEERGIAVSRPFLQEWRSELEKKLHQSERKLTKLSGKEINWNSPAQVKELLFSKRSHGGLGLKGGPSTDEASLVALKHPMGQALIDYRETFKQYTSYAVSLLEAIARDGAIHPTFKSTGARTGRTSCEDPNLQQQTRVSGVRRAYQPRKGLVFRMADYSQVEVRLAAHFANERTLIKGFLSDPDFDAHDATARMMFGRSYDGGKGQHRKFAKILNFTMIFGGGVPQITKKLMELMEYKEAVSGCRAFHVQPGSWPFDSLARALKSRYDEMMPAMKKATRAEAEIAERRGFVTNAYGRHRYLERDHRGEYRWYSSFNTKVQGSAGDAAKKGLVKVYKYQLETQEIGLMLIIHDELFYESEGKKSTDRNVLRLMAEPKRFKVPIIADMSGSKKSWQDKEKIKL